MQSDLVSEAEARCPDDTHPDEWRLRVQLAACYRVFDQLGWTELVFNHITVRVPGAQPAFLINPFGLNYDEVTARNLVKVGHDGVPLMPTPHHVNRAGFVIHTAVHAARPDAHCVMHTHTTAGMAVSCKRDGLGHDDFYGAELFGDVAYHDFEGVTVHDAEGPRLVASLADKRVLVLRNHGMLVAGDNVFNAFRWMWTLQRACEVQVAADSLGGPSLPLTDEVRRACAKDAKAFEPKEALERMLFMSVLRKGRVDAASLV
ncbi:MAG: Decarboxylase NovR [Rhizobacter sp.]|nr:Decarboxylase NovR [Rhizobacter sp.]